MSQKSVTIALVVALLACMVLGGLWVHSSSQLEKTNAELVQAKNDLKAFQASLRADRDQARVETLRSQAAQLFTQGGSDYAERR